MKFFYIILLLLLLTTFKQSNSSSSAYSMDSEISKLWIKSKIEFTHSINDLNRSPLELYFIGINSYNILSYSFMYKKNKIIDDLLNIYIQTTPYLTNSHKYTFSYLKYDERSSTRTLHNSYPIWLDKNGEEDILASSSFLRVVSLAINGISNLPIKDRTSVMKKFVKKFSPIVSAHYRRWILGVVSLDKRQLLGSFQRRGWGCKNNKEEYICARTLQEEIIKLDSYKGDSYCNSMTDVVMLINIGLGYYLSSNPDTIQKKKLTDFFKKSVHVFSTHFRPHVSYNFNKKAITTLGFEEGLWSEHPDFHYSLYIDSEFPSKKHQKINREVGIDISHASTVVAFLEMLVAHQKYFDIAFPTASEMKMFSNRFLYNVFNGDFQKPLFRNYMNGSNGWFRASTKGYGYAPYNLTSTALVGGYPRLGVYSLELKKIFNEIMRKLHSKNPVDRAFIEKFYQKSVWSNYHLKNEYNFYAEDIDSHTALFLINFYSALRSTF